MDLRAVMNASASMEEDEEDSDVEVAAAEQEKRDSLLQRGGDDENDREQDAVKMLSSIRQRSSSSTKSPRSTNSTRSSSSKSSAKSKSGDAGERRSADSSKERRDGDADGEAPSAAPKMTSAKHKAAASSSTEKNAKKKRRLSEAARAERSSLRQEADSRDQKNAGRGETSSVSKSKKKLVTHDDKSGKLLQEDHSSSSSSHNTPAKPTRTRKSSAADEIKIKEETTPLSMGGAGSATTNIPAAFLATQAFASPRDFFVAPESESDAGSHVVCTLCQATIGSRVYSLKRHLYRHHPQVFRIEASSTIPDDTLEHEQSKSTVNQPTDQSDDVVITLKQEPSAEATSTSKPSKRKHAASDDAIAFEKMNDAFVAWLRSDIIPVKALESKLFHQFLCEINPTFRVPEVLIQPRQVRQDDDAARVKQETRFMKGFWLQGNGNPPTVLTNLVIPKPQANEALIRIVRAGICGTDLMMVDNYKPGFKGVIGHEFVGIVVALGAFVCANDETREGRDEDDAYADLLDKRKQAWVGKRVVGEINIPCDGRECKTCTRAAQQQRDAVAQIKKRNHCPNRAALGIVGKNGVFAEFVTLPLQNLHVVPESVVDSHAVFAEPLAAACRILEQQTIQPWHHVAILGDGKLGLLCAEVLHAHGVAKTITLIGKHPEKLALMKHIVTATHTILDRPGADRTAPLDESFDVCVECTGSPGGISMALQIVKRHGVVIMKSTCSAKKSHVDFEHVHRKQVRVVGSRCGPFEMAMELLREKKVDVQKFIHGVYPLARAETALVHAAQRGTLKIQLVMV